MIKAKAMMKWLLAVVLLGLNAHQASAAPPAPTGLTAAGGNAQVVLSWTGSSGAASYNIYDGTLPGGEGVTPIRTGVTTTTYTAPNLVNGIKYYFTVAAVNSAGTSTQSNEASATTAAGGGGGAEGAYGGTAAAVPGTVQSENYDTGGQGVGYSVTSINGSANSYRADGVDLETTTDNGGGYNIGWTGAGQWFRYTVNVATAGAYTVSFRVAAPTAVTNAFSLANSAGTNLSSNINVPATGGYQTWTTVTTNVTLPAGKQVLTLNQNNAGWNINSMAFASSGGGGGGAPPVPTGIGAVAGNSQVTLSWSASSGATSYNVYRSTSSGGEGTTAFATGVTALTYNNPGLTNGTTYYYTIAAVNANGASAQSVQVSGKPASASGAPNFGPNVLIFTPSMPMATIQGQINTIYNQQISNQFGTSRYALLFQPGTYALDINIGFYTQVLGLGAMPDSTLINGYVETNASWNGANATDNFWRGAENFAVTPSDAGGYSEWAVSQACPWRRVHVKGNMTLADQTSNPPGWASGGFIADTAVDAKIYSISQQQFFTRNSNFSSWSNGVWNQVFVGDIGAPASAWPNPADNPITNPYTTIAATPVIREKPFLTVDASGAYSVFVPSLRANTQGTSWSSGTEAGASIPISNFYIALAGTDNAATINSALAAGKNILFTPGIYALGGTINVNNANTVLLGIGLATLQANTGQSAIQVADVDGVTVAGLLIESASNVGTLMQVGPVGGSVSHSANPTLLADVFFRIGGAVNGQTVTSLQINSSNVIGDDLWLWRADHGNAGAVGWTTNTATNGLVVNGQNVTIYGLAVEHFQQYQTLWNGNGGQTYFYQSEAPYDVPAQSSWMDGAVDGYASYKVANSVTSHQAYGLGIYCYFNVNPAGVILQNAIEAPSAPGVTFTHMMTDSLGGVGTISSIINGLGGAVNNNNGTQNLHTFLTSYP